MIVELAERGELIDMVLFADPGSEKAGTYAFLPIFRRWMAEWVPARRCWDAGDRVVKLIGYDASARDTQRYHHDTGCEDPRYAYRYPLREWGWDRARCEHRIAAAGLRSHRNRAVSSAAASNRMRCWSFQPTSYA